ncbi:MAG: hypothetical protein ABIS18_02700 [Actinomycetota bacterium]
MKLKRSIALVSALAVAWVTAFTPALAGVVIHDMTGTWTSETVSLEVDNQVNRRFTGVISFVDDPNIRPNIRLDGTVSESGHVSMVGNGPGVQLVIQGKLTEATIIPCVFEGRYQRRLRDGSVETGEIQGLFHEGTGSGGSR